MAYIDIALLFVLLSHWRFTIAVSVGYSTYMYSYMIHCVIQYTEDYTSHGS